MGKNVSLKGRADGIEVFIAPKADFNEALKELEDMFGGDHGFFANSKISLIFSGKPLDEMQKAIASHKIWSRLGESAEISCEKKADEIKTEFFRGILRSGRKLKSRGHMVVLGDVNPGAEILAAGNIVVFGALRGIAHAGCDGNREAIVAALKMNPSQLRIADVYAMAPEEGARQACVPEIAGIAGDKIVVEKLSVG